MNAWIRAALFGVSLSLSAPSAGEGLPLAENLQNAGYSKIHGNRPILLLFTSVSCPYCERVKAEIFDPLSTDKKFNEKAYVAQIELGLDWDLTNFRGEPTTHAEFGKKYKIKAVPALLIFSPDGKELHPPILGFSEPKTYLARVEAAIAAATDELRKSPRAAGGDPFVD